ncbi:MAG TPA: hypothetical protein VGM30_22315 [Puia sp.]|jgi:hypothetical protein
MQPKLLELHFSQLQTEWVTSKYNNYSDDRKNIYHEKLATIIEGLGKEDFASLDDSQIQERYWVIFFVFKSLEFLNHSTRSTIPFEMVYVLEVALKEWSPGDDYIIVTSLTNGMNEFSFDGSLSFYPFIYTYIENLYSVSFDYKLVQINLPESTSRDYLANVVLYHELGHFIEKKFAITRVIYAELLAAIRRADPAELNNIYRYFPYLRLPAKVDEFEKRYEEYNQLSMHISEYFCDLFASQYIKDCSNFYLEYVTLNQAVESTTHPSTINRIIFINEYLDNKGGFVLSEYKRIVERITGIEIGYKGKDFSTANFESLIPVEVKELSELHGLFHYGWKVWLGEWENIRQKAEIQFTLSNADVYAIINNLIEKSIGNFIVKNEWELIKV